MKNNTSIVVKKYGAPEVLELTNLEVEKPAANELLIRQTAIGVNFHDLYVRSGQYTTLSLPGVPGIEAAGVIEAVGSEVVGWQIGDRVAYVSRDYGAYTKYRLLPDHLAIAIPTSVSEQVAASMMVRGLTIEMLTTQVTHIKPGQVVLIHAAAGGVGQLLAHRCNELGAIVIGTVGSDARKQIALDAGCQAVFLYDDQNIIDYIQKLTLQKGVDIVYDSVGKNTIDLSFNVIRRLGHIIVFGQSSGNIQPIRIEKLAARSLTLSRPILFDYIEDNTAYQSMADNLFKTLQNNQLRTPPVETYPLVHASAAHQAMEDRSVNGAIVLIP